MIDYRKWRLDTPRAATLKDLRAVLDAARDEYLNTNTPAKQGPNKLWFVDEPLREAVCRQIQAGIEAAITVTTALGAGAYVRVSLSGHVIEMADDGVDERLNVFVDKVYAPKTGFAEWRKSQEATAAMDEGNGVVVSTLDNGWSSTAAPIAGP